MTHNKVYLGTSSEVFFEVAVPWKKNSRRVFLYNCLLIVGISKLK